MARPRKNVTLTETKPETNQEEGVSMSNVAPVSDNPITETVADEGDKKLGISRSELRELGLNVDPTEVEGPVDEDGNPKYKFRWCHEMHRKPRGGTGSWQVADWKFMESENIKLPNNPVSDFCKKKFDSKVYMMDHFLCYRPIEVNKKVRNFIDEKSKGKVQQSENMEAVAEGIRQQFGNNEAVKVMDAMMKVRGKKYY